MNGRCFSCGETEQLRFELQWGPLGWSDLHQRNMHKRTEWVCSEKCLQHLTETWYTSSEDGGADGEEHSS